MGKPVLHRWRSIPVLHDDEDICSYIVRLAAHSFMTPNQLLKLYIGSGSKPLANMPLAPQHYERIGLITGHSSADLHRAGLSRTAEAGAFCAFNEATIPAPWVSFSRRLAPGRMVADGDAPYTRVAWRFTSLSCDLSSGEHLLSRCPECGSKLTWHGQTMITTCSCGYDIRKVVPRFVDPATLEQERRLAGLFGLTGKARTIAPFPDPFCGHDMTTTAHLLEWCGYFEGLLRKDRMGLGPSAAARGLDVAQAWPATLELALELYVRTSRGEGGPTISFNDVAKRIRTSSVRKAILKQMAEFLAQPELLAQPKFQAKSDASRGPFYSLVTHR